MHTYTSAAFLQDLFVCEYSNCTRTRLAWPLGPGSLDLFLKPHSTAKLNSLPLFQGLPGPSRAFPSGALFLPGWRWHLRRACELGVASSESCGGPLEVEHVLIHVLCCLAIDSKPTNLWQTGQSTWQTKCKPHSNKAAWFKRFRQIDHPRVQEIHLSHNEVQQRGYVLRLVRSFKSWRETRLRLDWGLMANGNIQWE
jgi:hypothetical protein